jgi:hypothetical protein
MKGPEAFIPDPSSTRLSTEPLVNVSIWRTPVNLLTMSFAIHRQAQH